jgi:ATP-dependent RNA helicase DDX27
MAEQNDTSGPVDPSKFFASSEGASFHANSFLELNLSRPLVRACEALGYQKPTPIQVCTHNSLLLGHVLN